MGLEIAIMAFESLLANKTRTLLSMLGIVIGVSTVIAVFAIGEGAQQAVNEQFEGMSANSIIIMSMRGRGMTSSSKLSADDADVIRENSQYLSEVSAVISGNATASFGSESGTATIMGVEENYFDISSIDLDKGRLFDEDDLLYNEKVVILGSGAVETYFPDEETVVGKIMKIAGKQFEVVGILEETGRNMGPSTLDDTIFVPQTTAEKSVTGSSGSIMIFTLVGDIDNVEFATTELTSILREEHRLRDSQEDDFNLMDAGSMVSAAQESASLMKFVLTAVAAIVLLVSGIGIMNVMFVTVAERTKEIGIARAIGGKQGDILNQFLLESIILSMIGGFVGVLLGSAAIPAISATGQLVVAFSWMGPLIGFSFSVMVGVFFGFYPAYRASRLDPVDALRSE
jgi:putative ABC transport system permease protein